MARAVRCSRARRIVDWDPTDSLLGWPHIAETNCVEPLIRRHLRDATLDSVLDRRPRYVIPIVVVDTLIYEPPIGNLRWSARPWYDTKAASLPSHEDIF